MVRPCSTNVKSLKAHPSCLLIISCVLLQEGSRLAGVGKPHRRKESRPPAHELQPAATASQLDAGQPDKKQKVHGHG